MLQRDLHEALRARIQASHSRLKSLLRTLDGERLTRRPPDGGWSAGEVLEHLLVSSEAYDPLVLALLRESRPDAGAPLREWTPSFVGKLLVRSLEATRRLPAPRMVRPGATLRGGVVEAFLAKQLAFIARLDSAASHDWRALILHSPLVPAVLRPLARMNLGDAFFIEVVHVERHARQIERVLAATG